MTRNFKQAWQILKQNKFYSSIYILGSAISIAFVMVIIIVWSAMTKDIAPEINRSRTMVLNVVKTLDSKDSDIWRVVSAPSHKVTEFFLEDIDGLEAIAEVARPWNNTSKVISQESTTMYWGSYSMVNEDFWKIFDIKFLAGAAFSKEDIESGVKKVIISENFAKEIFNRIDVVGEEVEVDYVRYIISGVTESVPVIMSASYADLWMPISLFPTYYKYLEEPLNEQLHGNLDIYLLLKDGVKSSEIKDIIDEKMNRLNSGLEDMEYSFNNQPENHYTSLMRRYKSDVPSVGKYVMGYILAIFIILLIPSLNLSGMISSSMQRRLEEIGVRKAIGATDTNILRQIINENFLLSLLGGVVGLFLAYVLLMILGEDILPLVNPQFDAFVMMPKKGPVYNFTSLFNFSTATILLLLTSLLNILSALIPATYAMRRNIVESLNTVKK